MQRRSTVDAIAGQFGFAYPWSEPSLAVAGRLDFVARADDVAAKGEPAVLLAVGEDDLADGFREPAARLHDALGARYRDSARTQMVVVPGMAHALAEEPGMGTAPQTPHAAEVDRRAVDWLRRHLV